MNSAKLKPAVKDAAMTGKPSFELKDLDGDARAYPSSRPTLLCFVKEDCETCNTAAPVIESLHRAYGTEADVWMISQTSEGSLILRDRHGLTLPILDDSDLKTSFAYDFSIVPALYWFSDGETVETAFEGFVKSEWQDLDVAVAVKLEAELAGIDLDVFPVWRPGCGSKHLDLEMNDHLRAEAEDSPIRAR